MHLLSKINEMFAKLRIAFWEWIKFTAARKRGLSNPKAGPFLMKHLTWTVGQIEERLGVSCFAVHSKRENTPEKLNSYTKRKKQMHSALNTHQPHSTKRQRIQKCIQDCVSLFEHHKVTSGKKGPVERLRFQKHWYLKQPARSKIKREFQISNKVQWNRKVCSREQSLSVLKWKPTQISKNSEI